MKRYVLAIDQGTTSTRSIIFNHSGEIVSSHQLEHQQIFPQAGWVEHDALEIWQRTCDVIQAALSNSKIPPEEIAAVGVTNQRETTVVWNPKTGEILANAIVWQDTRTIDICENLIREGGKDRFREKTGLPVATYFSGPKLQWMLEHYPAVREASARGEAVFGTMDTWIIWNLTGGKNGGAHITDVTNASRTMLMDLKTLDWDSGQLELFGIPRKMLPEIKPSIEPETYGMTRKDGPLGYEIPICGALGDQQAALFGQTCFEIGEAKNTYGTGCFLLLNTGKALIQSRCGLITTVGYKIGKEAPVYALEGSVAIAGALVQWARDKMGLIQNSPDINLLAEKVPDNGGVYIVPAFSGLFAPYWRSDARGVITGLSQFAGKEHIARAILEATAYQTREIFEAMKKDSYIALASLKVDGGMTASNLLMQFQADILGVPVIRPKVAETTALGAAYAAGLASGFWNNLEELQNNWERDKTWYPIMAQEKKELLYGKWLKAVEKTFGGWARGDVAKPSFTAIPPLSGRRLYFIQRPNSVQSSISVGNFAIKRSDPRYFTPLLSALEKDGLVVPDRDIVKLGGKVARKSVSGEDLSGKIALFLQEGSIEPPTEEDKEHNP